MMNASIEPLNPISSTSPVVLANKIYLDITQMTISEGSAALINIVLEEKSDADVIVNLTINDPYNRFQSVPSTLTINKNTLSRSLLLQSIDDNIYQGTQVVSLSISNSSSNIIADPNTLTISLVDNEAAPSITIADGLANENNSPLKLAVTLSRVSIYDTKFDWSTQDSSALAGSDFIAVTANQFVIPAGQTSGEVAISLVNDSVSEANETLSINISNPVNGTLANTSAVATIVDEDAVPAISFNSAILTVNENNGTLQIPLSLNSTSDQNVTVPFTISGSVSGADYTMVSSSPITILAGQLNATVDLTITDDLLDEANENLIITFGAPTNASLGVNSTFTLTIQDNDATPSVQLSSSSQSLNENVGTPVTVDLTLSAVSGQDVIVPVALSGSASGSGVDYQIVNTLPITIPAGTTTVTINFTVVNDSAVESSETIIATLGSPTNASLGAVTAHTMTINDDDVYISINDVTVNESSGTATFTISLNQTSINNVSVNWATANGTATSGVNYTGNSGTVIINSGQTTATVVVSIIDTAGLCEGDRVFNVNLSSPTNGTIQDSQGIGAIQENDFPTISISDGNEIEGLMIGPTVSLSQTCNIPISVEYSTTNNTATAGLDFFGVTNLTLTIPAGLDSTKAAVTTFNDSVVESTENFNVIISNPSHGSIISATAVGTIIDNDVTTAVANNISQASVGGYHVCAVTSAGDVKCWGRNTSGQIGKGTTSVHENTPVTVGVGGLATKVSGGGTTANPGFNCAIVGGGAKCWGYNGYGQLGNGSTTSSSTPVNVNGLSSNVTDITTGGSFSCAVVNGGAKCWGLNSYGQLGNSTTTSSSVPVDVTGLTSGVSSISSGQYSACAVLLDGTIKCWGRNTYGQLGDGTTTDSSSPVAVLNITSGATKVDISYHHACAIVSGGAKCWGNNGNGQLGDSTTVAKLFPVDVTGMTSGVVDIQVASDDLWGYPTSCAVTSGGAVYCWGNNTLRLLLSSSSFVTSPVAISGLSSGATQVTFETSSACAVVSNSLKCWGTDHYGNFARPGHQKNTFPNDTFLTTGVDSFSNGGYGTSCAVINGAAKCWGVGSTGSIGDGLGTSSATMKDVTGLSSGVVKIVVAGHGGGGDGTIHACAMKNDGSLYCWGSNNSGQLGDGTTTTRLSPVLVFASGVIDVEVAFGNHTCAILTGGALKCWGYNAYGQLGNGTTTSSSVPVDVTGLSSGVTQVAASRTHTCAIVNGGMKCWGSNVRGELGQGSTGVPQLTPIDVPGLTSNVSYIAATGVYNVNRTCAIVNGGAKCWGYAYNGALGVGPSSDRYSPTNVVGLTSGVSKIQLNDGNACALTNVGALKCWGGNGNGEAGVGTTTEYNVPMNVVGMQSGVLDFDVGYASTCAKVVGGSVKCWGSNYYGNIGYGYFQFAVASAVDILFP
jgi:alpha-tubulin suppressor-like RCC1 family protein